MASPPPAAETDERYVFISYSRNDQGYVIDLVEHLNRCQIQTWVDIDTDYGDSWPRVTRDRVDGCSALIVVMTPASEDSEWVRREVIRAQQKAKTILPLLLDGLAFFELNTTQHEDVAGHHMPANGFIRRLQHLTNPAPTSTPEVEDQLKTAQDWVDEASRLALVKNWNDSLMAAVRAIELDPDNANGHFYRGWALEELGRYEEALRAADTAIDLDPNNAYAHNNRSTTLRNLSRLEDALVAVDRAIELDPAYTYAHNSRGLTLAHLHRWEDALFAVDRAIGLDPDNAYVLDTKGHVLNGLGKYSEALEVLDQALAHDPELGWAHYNRGHALHGLGRQKEALISYQRASDLGLR